MHLLIHRKSEPKNGCLFFSTDCKSSEFVYSSEWVWRESLGVVYTYNTGTAASFHQKSFHCFEETLWWAKIVCILKYILYSDNSQWGFLAIIFQLCWKGDVSPNILGNHKLLPPDLHENVPRKHVWDFWKVTGFCAYTSLCMWTCVHANMCVCKHRWNTTSLQDDYYAH